APAPGHGHGALAQPAAKVRGLARARHATAHAVPRQDLQHDHRARGLGMAASLIAGHTTDARLNEQLLSTTWRSGGRGWRWAFLVTAAGTLLLLTCITYTVWVGIGAWGNNIPVAWGFGIINFVWWIGIGHAGTFISAVLLLFEQRWRSSINRFAEAMTLFA